MRIIKEFLRQLFCRHFYRVVRFSPLSDSSVEMVVRYRCCKCGKEVVKFYP